jgi:hypothetical protein
MRGLINIRFGASWVKTGPAGRVTFLEFYSLGRSFQGRSCFAQDGRFIGRTHEIVNGL